jgi:5-methylcytosine-specific restriction endonuclease McrA
MKQVESFAIDRANGDIWKKDALKKQLMADTGGHCMHCGRAFKATSLHLHRVDPKYRLDESKHCGYFRENVRLLCADCHHEVGRKQKA